MQKVQTGSAALWHYQKISEKGYDADIGEFVTYAICLSGPDCSEVLHDVCVCEHTVNRIIELFNRHQLFPVHFKEAVEELLCELEY